MPLDVDDAVAGELRRRIEDALAVLVHRGAEQQGGPDTRLLSFELVLEDDGPGTEPWCPNLPQHPVALEVVETELRRHAVLLGRHAERVRPDEDERQLTELVADDHVAAPEGFRRLDRVAAQVGGRVGYPAAIFVDGIAEAERLDDPGALGAKRAHERHVAPRELGFACLLELVALEVIGQRRGSGAPEREEEGENGAEAAGKLGVAEHVRIPPTFAAEHEQLSHGRQGGAVEKGFSSPVAARGSGRRPLARDRLVTPAARRVHAST